MKITWVGWLRAALMPVRVTVYGFVFVELHDSVEVPEPVTLFGVMDPQTRPGGGVLDERDTVPAKSLRAVTVIVDVAEDPTNADAGDAVIVKS